eukprot:366536-Chlamydomonas_euryale.AAC.8
MVLTRPRQQLIHNPPHKRVGVALVLGCKTRVLSVLACSPENDGGTAAERPSACAGGRRSCVFGSRRVAEASIGVVSQSSELHDEECGELGRRANCERGRAGGCTSRPTRHRKYPTPFVWEKA